MPVSAMKSACIPAITPRPSSRKPPRLIQVCIKPRRDEAAIPRQQWRFRHQRRLQQVHQRLMPHQGRRRPSQQRGRTLQPRRHSHGLRQSRPNGGQIARPAPVQRQP